MGLLQQKSEKCNIATDNSIILLHVRFPWQPDGALSRNNGIVQNCCVSLATQQCWTALASLADNSVDKQHCYARNNRQAFPRSQDCFVSIDSVF
jgi:hypothetical protein